MPLIALRAIKAAITAKLKTKYPTCKVHFDNVEKSDAPYFYVEFTTSIHQTLDETYTDRTIQVDVTYIHPKDAKGRVNRSAVFDVGDDLDTLFRPVFQVGDRYITILSAERTMVDDVLHYIFDLQFTDAWTDEEVGYIRGELMQTLGLSLNGSDLTEQD
jgi:hypothetical protein